MKRKMYCYPNYEEAREAFHNTLANIELESSIAGGLGVTITANRTSLEIRYVSEFINQDVIFKFTYIPIKVSIDMERIAGFQGEVHLYPLLSELNRQVEIAKTHMYAFAAIAEETDGSKNKGTTGTGKPTEQVTQSR